MRILILGSSGMLGRTLVRRLSAHAELEVVGTVRSRSWEMQYPGVYIEEGVDACEFVTVAHCLEKFQPDLVVNCVGIIKQSAAATNAPRVVYTNGLFPLLLAAECDRRAIRLVHISTDCVFSGQRGQYTEDDVPDPVDLYGRSKSVGEPPIPALTLRTSIIGHELRTKLSLVDWFLSQNGRINGYTRAIYSGVTTVELASLLQRVALRHSELSGLYHVASTPISKFDLLHLIKKQYGWPGTIAPNDELYCDRSLIGDRLFQAIGYQAPAWEQMVKAMYEDREVRSNP